MKSRNVLKPRQVHLREHVPAAVHDEDVQVDRVRRVSREVHLEVVRPALRREEPEGDVVLPLEPDRDVAIHVMVHGPVDVDHDLGLREADDEGGDRGEGRGPSHQTRRHKDQGEERGDDRDHRAPLHHLQPHPRVATPGS